MKKIVTLTMLAFGMVTAVANATANNTISLGYAQSHTNVKDLVKDADAATKKGLVDNFKNLKGFNLKYRYELDSQVGMITSFTHTQGDHESKAGNQKIKEFNVNYNSLMIGPAFRFNEYVSAYATIGAARGKTELKIRDKKVDSTRSRTALAYGAGLQFNPIENVVIDASYELSKISVTKGTDVKVGTWVVGVGYRF